jgi:hypothetical protein
MYLWTIHNVHRNARRGPVEEAKVHISYTRTCGGDIHRVIGLPPSIGDNIGYLHGVLATSLETPHQEVMKRSATLW